MQTLETKAPFSAILGVVKPLTDAGWLVLGISELMFEGDVPPMLSKSNMAQDPQRVRHLSFLMPHGDHFHHYILTIVRPDLDLTQTSLTTELLTGLADMDMSQRANVSEVGRA